MCIFSGLHAGSVLKNHNLHSRKRFSQYRPLLTYLSVCIYMGEHNCCFKIALEFHSILDLYMPQTFQTY